MSSPLTINFVLSANDDNSISRLIAEYAKLLSKRNYKIIISYPLFDYLDFHIWRQKRQKKNKRVSYLKYLHNTYKPVISATIREVLNKKKKRWIGEIIYGTDTFNIIYNPYYFFPSVFNMPASDFILVFQEYLFPHLSSFPQSKGRILGSLHLDYMNAVMDKDDTIRDWWKHNLEITQRMTIPFWVTSNRVFENCKKLGINVTRVIYNGVDVSGFKDGLRRGSIRPLRILLYCDKRPQKGLEFGLEVVKELKSVVSSQEALFLSLGSITKKQEEIFDLNLGYITSKNYANAYMTSDIFIFPTFYEGFPAPPLDAMASGCVLITTKVQGVEDYAIHEVNSMVSEPGDRHSMVSNIVKVVKNTELRDTLRVNGRKTASKFSWINSTIELEKYLHSV